MYSSGPEKTLERNSFGSSLKPCDFPFLKDTSKWNFRTNRVWIAGCFIKHCGDYSALTTWSRVARVFWAPIRDAANEIGGRPLRILDIATGPGDLPIKLWRWGRRAGLDLCFEGCDVNPHTVAFAQGKAKSEQADVRFFSLNVLEQSIPAEYDVVMCSLFLHHLTEPQAIDLMRRMAEAARQMVLVNDLIRGLAGWILAYLGTRLLITSPVNRVDGPRSVAAAFSVDEVRSLARQAGLQTAVIEKCWPCRFLLTWRRH